MFGILFEFWHRDTLARILFSRFGTIGRLIKTTQTFWFRFAYALEKGIIVVTATTDTMAKGMAHWFVLERERSTLLAI
jgi:hypothetical protein